MIRFFIPLVLVLSTYAAHATADLYVAAASANSVMRFDEQTGAFLGNFVAPGSGGLGDPQGIAFGPDGNLYVASNATNNILRFDGKTGAFIDVFVTPGMAWPAEINFRDNMLYVSDFGGNRVARYDAMTGAFIDNFAVGIQGTDGQSWDADGNFYVSSWNDSAIRKFDGITGASMGNFVSPGLGGLNGPLDNLFLPNGELLVVSYNNSRIKRYDSMGAYIDDPIQIAFPQGLQIGPDGNLYVGSFTNGIINKYDINSFAFLGTFATANSMTNNFVFYSAVPEPCSLPLLGLAFASAAIRRQRRKR